MIPSRSLMAALLSGIILVPMACDRIVHRPVDHQLASSPGIPGSNVDSIIMVRPARTNHPHDRSASSAISLRLREAGMEISDESSALEAMHARWDRASRQGVELGGEPDLLPADLIVVVRQSSSASDRRIYGLDLVESQTTLYAEVRTVRDGELVGAVDSQGTGVEADATIALDAATINAADDLAAELAPLIVGVVDGLSSGRMGLMVESVGGGLGRVLRKMDESDGNIQLATNLVEGREHVRIDLVTWREMAETGVVILEARPGWVLIEVDTAFDRDLLLVLGSIGTGLFLLVTILGFRRIQMGSRKSG